MADQRQNTSDPAGIDQLVKEKMQDSLDRGWVPFIGKVNEDAAPWLNMAVNWAMAIVSQRGGTKAREWVTDAAKKAMSPEKAAKLGLGAELLFRVGAPIGIAASEIGTTVHDSYKSMNKLREDASVLLAANNDMDTSIGNVLTTKFTALANKRALVYKQTRRNVTGSFLNVLSQVPTFMIGYNQYQVDRIEDPQTAVNQMPSTATQEEKQAVHDKYMAMRQRPADYQEPKQNKFDRLADNIPEEMRDDPILQNLNRASWLMDPQARQSMVKPRWWGDYKQNLKNLMLMPPLVTAGVNWAKKKFVSKDDDKFVAWDIIKEELEPYLAKHRRPDMNEVTVMVQHIFQQHARDLGMKYSLEGPSFDATAEAIANALVYKKLPAQALAEILDNKKIVTFGARDADFGDIEDVRSELAGLKDKYVKVSEKDFYQSASFTKGSLLKTYKNIPAEEKAFFVMTMPPGILEKAGADKEEVAKYRSEGKQLISEELTDKVTLLIGMGRDELKKYGVKSKYLDELEIFERDFRRADASGDGREFIQQNAEDAMKLVRNVVGSAKKPEELWKDFVARGGEETGRTAPPRKSLIEHARRAAGDEVSASV